HPTLQPIELIWGIVKGRIARTPPKSGADVVKKVLQGLKEIRPFYCVLKFGIMKYAEYNKFG
ncbi:hypothetical protein F441_00917, partial [Phytophthora nicotianae CJ01A1]